MKEIFIIIIINGLENDTNLRKDMFASPPYVVLSKKMLPSYLIYSKSCSATKLFFVWNANIEILVHIQVDFQRIHTYL